MLKLKLLSAFDGFLLNSVGPFYRRIAKNLIVSGNQNQAELGSDDRLVQCLRAQPANGHTPVTDSAIFTAPNSVMVGQVILGQNASVWYGATLRADQHPITIGKNSIIQDNTYIKATRPTTISGNVYVGPNSNLQGCTVGDDAFIGMGATIREGAKVNGIVAAGSKVPQDTEIKQGEVWAGSPAKYLRDITPQELQLLKEYKWELVQLAQIHGEENTKSFRQIMEDTDDRVHKGLRNSEEEALEEIAKLNFPLEGEEEEFVEQRVFMKEQPTFYNDSDALKENLGPYEQDLSQFPENFQKYGEDYELYEKAQRYFEQNPTAKAEQFPQKPQIQDEESWNRRY